MWKKIAYLLFVLFMMIMTLIGSMFYYGSKIYTNYEKELTSDFQNSPTGEDAELVDTVLSDSLYLKEPVFTFVEENHGEVGNDLAVKAFAIERLQEVGYYFIVENTVIDDFMEVSGAVATTETSSASVTDATTDAGPDAIFYGLDDKQFKVDNWSSYAYSNSDIALTGQVARFFISKKDIKDSLGGQINGISLESGVPGVMAIEINSVTGLSLEQTSFFEFTDKLLSTDNGFADEAEFTEALNALNKTLKTEDPSNEAVIAITTMDLFKENHFFTFVIAWMVGMLIFLIAIGYYFIWRKKPGYVPSGKHYLRNDTTTKTTVNSVPKKNVNMNSISNEVIDETENKTE